MNELQHYYEILGLSIGASQADVKQAYRQLAKIWHPDRFIQNTPDKHHAEAQFKQINEAYEYLKDYQPNPQDLPPPEPDKPPIQHPVSTQSTVTTRRTDPELFYQRGAELVKAGLYTESLEEFSMAIRLDPSYAEAYRYRGFVHSMLGFELGAEADLKKAKTLELEHRVNGRSRTSAAAHPTPTQKREQHSRSQTSPPPPQSWRCVEMWTGSAGVTAIAASHSGKLLVSSHLDGTIALWNLRTSKQFFTLPGHTDTVLSLALSRDGKLLVSGGRDQTICLWDVQAGTLLHKFVWHSASVQSVALSLDRQFLASGSLDGTMQLWKVGSQQPVQLGGNSQTPIRAIALSADGQTLISGDDSGAIRLYRVRTGELLRTIYGEGALVALAQSSNGRYFATATATGLLQLWDDRSIVTGQPLKTIAAHAAAVRSLTFSPDQQTLASASDDHTIQLWNVASQTHVGQLTDHTAEVTAVEFSADGKLLMSGCRDRTIKLWKR
jgi:COMPASS component SWD3